MTALRKTGTCLFVLHFCLVALQAQVGEVFDVPFPRQYHVIDSIIDDLAKGDTATASGVLRELNKAAQETGKTLPLLNFKRSALRYRYIRIYYSQDTVAILKLIHDAQELLETVDEKQYPVIAALIHQNLGNTLNYKTYQYYDAFQHYLEAYNLFKNIPTAQFPDRQYAQYSIALAYYQFKDYENALKLGEEIESLYPNKNYISVFTVNLMGMSYLKMDQPNKALPKFQWILDHFQECGVSTAWEGITLGNMGQTYHLMGDDASAIPRLENGVDITVKEGVSDNAAGFATILANIYLGRKNMPLAKKYLDIAQRETLKSGDVANVYVVYGAWSDYYRQTGQNLLALNCRDTMLIFKDSLEKINDVGLKHKAEMAVEQERAIHQNILFEAEQVRQKLIRNAALLFAFLVLLVVSLLFNRRYLKHKNEKQQLLAKQQLAHQELENARKQLEDFKTSIVKKNELIEKAYGEIERINSTFGKPPKDPLGAAASEREDDPTLKSLHDIVLLTDKDWNEFSTLINKVYPGFFIRLKQEIPQLSPADKRFVTLSKLQLTNKEMAAMLGVSTDAVRQNRSRLLRKLNLKKDASLQEFIDAI